MTDNRPQTRTNGTNGGQPTIRDVAERAGVSKSLVSLVLRDAPHVRPEKRQAVLAAIKELGYRPNATARSLTERRTRAVGVVVNDLHNAWIVDCVDGLNTELSSSGMHMFIGDGRLDRRNDERLLNAFVDMRVDGLVLVGTMPTSTGLAEAASRVPTVVAGDRDLRFPHVDIVGVDDVRGGEIATRHLIDLGHQRIAHLAGNYGAFSTRRQSSYEDTMREHGLEENILIEACDATEEGGYRATIRLLTHTPRPTAIFAVNDMASVGALSAAAELGIAVPNQLSIVGYDNTHLARIRHLWLTSVDIATYETGRQSARLLLDRIADPTRDEVEHLLTPTLEIRGTTAPPP
jgi:DNA-binding LacI/PurR family transcriptional regulator